MAYSCSVTEGTTIHREAEDDLCSRNTGRKVVGYGGVSREVGAVKVGLVARNRVPGALDRKVGKCNYQLINMHLNIGSMNEKIGIQTHGIIIAHQVQMITEPCHLIQSQ